MGAMPPAIWGGYIGGICGCCPSLECAKFPGVQDARLKKKYSLCGNFVSEISSFRLKCCVIVSLSEF